MADGILAVDVLDHADDKELKRMVGLSIDYWTKVRKFKLISDDQGDPDIITTHQNAVVNDKGKYEPGKGQSITARVILVYQKVG